MLLAAEGLQNWRSGGIGRSECTFDFIFRVVLALVQLREYRFGGVPRAELQPSLS